MTDHARRWNLGKVEAGIIDDEALGELVRRGALAVQKEAGLTEDGLAGPKTLDAIEDLIGRVPQGSGSHNGKPTSDPLMIPRRRGIEAFYGSFSYKQHPDTPGAIIIDREWVKKNIVKLELYTGQVVWCHRLIAWHLGELHEKACKETGYIPKKIASWVPRHMRWDKKRKLSYHSWGIAFDVDWHRNGINMSDTPLQRNPRWVEIFKNAGVRWGGDWKRYKDDMHFEFVAP